MRDFADFLRHLIDIAPPAFWPLIVGFLVSATFTQWLKFFFPRKWTKFLKATMARLVAFGTGFGVTTYLWPDKYGMACGVLIGTVSPTVFAIMQRLISTQWRKRLSQDTR